ncbi:uncharacterized protein LOC142169582 [Nicotiana tabacum]|uniref:Uncharacterized protein LOC142169582 n=1 Tax=Nicotiana tabacum TaxID=4097 RepID=A0AC58SRG6_TOBAC
MAAPPNFEEGQSTYRPPRFNGQYYRWWKTRMHDFIMAEDYELWDVICDGPFFPPRILISACQSAKEIWEALHIAHEGTTQVKQSKIDMLTTEYELFRIKDDEPIQYMHTRFTSIINELHSLGETIPRNKLVRKILSVLPSSWESKVNSITEAKDLQTLTIDELVGNLKTHEMKKNKDNEIREHKREKNLVLKIDSNDSSGEDGDMAYLTRIFHKMVCRNGGIPKRENSSKPNNYDLYHKCGKTGYFIKECPLLKQDQYKNNFDKAAKRNPVPDKCFKRKNVADNVVKQALAAWGESSSESKEENDHGDSSMMAVESEATDLINGKDALTVELGEAEQTRDDLVIVVVDLKEIIENLKKEKDALDEKIANIEHERDDLMVAVVDLKETLECERKDKEVLVERVANIEHERDDLLVVVLDLKETIGEPKIESRPENSQKGKEICDKGNKVEFVSKVCTVTNIVTSEVVLAAKRYKNIYVANFEFLQNGDLNCLSAINDDAELWHRRLGHASFTLLNKLVGKDLICGFPKSSFKNHKVCDACVKDSPGHCFSEPRTKPFKCLLLSSKRFK